MKKTTAEAILGGKPPTIKFKVALDSSRLPVALAAGSRCSNSINNSFK